MIASIIGKFVPESAVVWCRICGDSVMGVGVGTLDLRDDNLEKDGLLQCLFFMNI